MLAHAYCRHRAKSTIFPLISRPREHESRDLRQGRGAGAG